MLQENLRNPSQDLRWKSAFIKHNPRKRVEVVDIAKRDFLQDWMTEGVRDLVRRAFFTCVQDAVDPRGSMLPKFFIFRAIPSMFEAPFFIELLTVRLGSVPVFWGNGWI